MKYLAIFLILLVPIWGCSEKSEDKPLLKINVSTSVFFGEDSLSLSDKSYTSPNEETLTFTTLNLFVSNFYFLNENNERQYFPKDAHYFLLRSSDPESFRRKLVGLEKGTYKGVGFIIGVDSLKSCAPSAQRKGDLDVTAFSGVDGMYWTWNSGYIFFKLEGTSPQAPENPLGARKFEYHIGGFGGYKEPGLNLIKEVYLPFDQLTSFEPSSNHSIQLKIDLSEVFKNPSPLLVSEESAITSGSSMQKVSDNYADIFSLISVE